ncbi:MAG TPA: hypothetical protein VNS34_00425 [Rhizobiaceae bacterium]|nr:hypothetical protein [Rhizobiaceae bacterium]
MASADEPARLDLKQIIERFPGKGSLIRRLALKDEAFRTICEEYTLARASLSWFEARPDASERPEIPDYKSVIAALEDEIQEFLKNARVL